MLDDTICEQLSTAETGLLFALRSENDLTTYHTNFAKLLETISESTSTGRLDKSTATLAQNVAMRVETIANGFAEIESEFRGLRDRLHDGWRNLLAKLPDSSPHQSQTFHSQEALTGDDTPLRLTYYLPPAYEWLLANLHNPYPTAEVKDRIASRAACSVASLNSWFTSVRRRIGWTFICREHFRNRRADAVGAAFCVLVKEDPSRVVPSEVAEAFLTMKKTAQRLYTSTFAEGPFAIDPHEVVNGVSESDNPHSDDSSKDTQELERQVGSDEDLFDRPFSRRTLNSPTANPFHRPSRSPSPVPTLESSYSSESDGADDVNPPIVTGQKRSVCSQDGSDLDHGRGCAGKRRRISVVSDCNAEVSDRNIVPLTWTPGNESSPNSPKASLQVTSMPGRTRKRRLSATDRQSHPKRPQGVPNGPRVQAVSDPLPKSSATESSIDDWLNINFSDIFDVPPPVDVDELEPSAPWQIELFSDYRIPEVPRRKFQKGDSIVTRTSCPPAYTSRPMVDRAASEMPGFSFLQSFDNCLNDQTLLTPDTNGSHLIAARLFDTDLSPLGVCSEPAFPTDPCDFLDSASSQSFVAVDDYDSQDADLSTAQTPTWMNTFFEPLQSSSLELNYPSTILDSQLYRQLSSACS